HINPGECEPCARVDWRGRGQCSKARVIDDPLRNPIWWRGKWKHLLNMPPGDLSGNRSDFGTCQEGFVRTSLTRGERGGRNAVGGLNKR
ncbi:hypothetical protein NPIL_691751, partial [Nephila pilipes]